MSVTNEAQVADKVRSEMLNAASAREAMAESYSGIADLLIDILSELRQVNGRPARLEGAEAGKPQLAVVIPLLAA